MNQEISDNAANPASSTEKQAQQFIINRADAITRRKKANQWVIGLGLTLLTSFGYVSYKAIKHEAANDNMAKAGLILAVFSTVGSVLVGMKKMVDAQQAHDEAVENDRALVDITGDITQAQFDETCIDIYHEHRGIAQDNIVPIVPRVA